MIFFPHDYIDSFEKSKRKSKNKKFYNSLIKHEIKGHNTANNKFLKSYDPNKPSTHIVYLIANNLCRHSMVHLLLTELPNWANPKYFNLYNCSNSNLIGCLLKVDLDCLDELRALRNDYPLAPEMRKFTKKCYLNINKKS